MAGCHTSGITAMQQQLQAERQMHDTTVKLLLEQHRCSRLLKQQLIDLECRAADRQGGCAKLLKHLAVSVMCLAAGAAAAVVRLPVETTRLAPAWQALAAPAMTGLIAAKTTATVLGGIGLLVRVLKPRKQQQCGHHHHQHKRRT